jgi:hypothetical protein
MLNQVTRTIEPYMPLKDTLADWHRLSESLAERPRKRKAQLTEYFEH